ncbi:hypothetical protein FA95DRAFT_1021321 [Auriscalpium vulgare]|uniref:Uncharacterized protein n=1 Tax=Auriscalpium vulgare TaxID=40419 RepID=A0ACB8R766_9AGAM|nr:hypothetical protein FA95DRAFT_1021321 [Auriscalpium vulgare]
MYILSSYLQRAPVLRKHTAYSPPRPGCLDLTRELHVAGGAVNAAALSTCAPARAVSLNQTAPDPVLRAAFEQQAHFMLELHRSMIAALGHAESDPYAHSAEPQGSIAPEPAAASQAAPARAPAPIASPAK